MTWRKFSGEIINSPILEEVERAIEREANLGNKLKVCIGTDSQVKGLVTDFATVIVFLREQRGGFMFIHNEKTKQRFTIRERMLVEVAKSIEIAYELCDLFNQYDVDMEVHQPRNRRSRQGPIADALHDLQARPAMSGGAGRRGVLPLGGAAASENGVEGVGGHQLQVR